MLVSFTTTSPLGGWPGLQPGPSPTPSSSSLLEMMVRVRDLPGMYLYSGGEEEDDPEDEEGFWV